MPDGTVWTNPWYTASATSWPTITELSAQGAVLHQFAIGPHGGAEDLEVGPSGLPWFSYGSTPWGVGEVEPGPIAKVHGWNYFYNPTTMVLGADGRMWMAWSQLNLPGLYGYYDTATQSATMFFMPSTSGGLFAMAAGANGTIDITAQDSYLYVVQTGATTSLSTIATSLPTPAEAFASVAVVAAGAAISIGAILFITFPSQLFNLTFQENYAEIRELLQRRVKWALRPKKASETSRQSVADWVKFVAVVLVGALLGGLLDPHFGTSLERSTPTWRSSSPSVSARRSRRLSRISTTVFATKTDRGGSRHCRSASALRPSACSSPGWRSSSPATSTA